MEKLFEVLLNALQSGRDCFLATIVESSGSTPRSAGAYMLIDTNGRLYGTIGGGNLEYQAILTGQQRLAEHSSFIYDYVLTAEHSAQLGMICGGSCRVLFYYFASAADDLALAEKLLQTAEAKKEYYLLLPLGEGKIDIRNNFALAGRKGIVTVGEKQYYAEQFAYDGKVYIFGGGHLAQELVPLLSHLDFQCTVIEDRPEFADRSLFPAAEQVILADFKQLAGKIQIKANDYVAIMTRGHLHDADAERFVLNTDAGYIGVVGSRKKAALTKNTLLAEGFSQKQLERIITPIGIDIKSETPAEIAVSIAAQLIQERAKKYS